MREQHTIWHVRCSTNAGGLPELNVDGKTGFLSNPGDIESMTKNALYILDPKNLPYFKENALLRAKDFDVSKILPLYEAYYVKTVNQNKKILQ